MHKFATKPLTQKLITWRCLFLKNNLLPNKKTNSIAIARIESRMASEQDIVAIPSKPPNDSHENNPVLQSVRH